MKIKERQLQEAIRDAINRTELFWAVIVDVNPVFFKGRWIKNQAKSGMSDLIVFCRRDRRVILLEVKKDSAGLNPNQKEFRRLCQLNNVIYDIVNDSHRALRILQYWSRRWKLRDRTLEAILEQLGE